MTEKKAINHFLNESIDPEVNVSGIFSSFTIALSEIRKTTARDLKTGKRINHYESNSWLGAIGYMSLLDMLGSCLKPISKSETDKRAIVRILKYFANLSDEEISALYALRCAFTHDFSLYNINFKDQELMHNFVIRFGSNHSAIELPKKYWDGKFENRSDDNQTIVYLEKFGDIVEDICKTIILLAKDDKLEIALKGGVAELINRYTFTQKITISFSPSKSIKVSNVTVKK